MDCDLLYMEQPTSVHSCNPYISRVKLCCALYGLYGLKNHTIRWYRRVNVTHTELLNSVNSSYKNNLLKGRLVIGNQSSLLPGDYWCQVGLKEENNSSYVPSSSFRLLPEEEYENYPPCNNALLSQQKTMCARDGVTWPFLPTVVPVCTLYSSSFLYMYWA